MQILNLTNHNATPVQLEAGVVEPAELREEIKLLLNVEVDEEIEDIRLQAKMLAQRVAVEGYEVAMIGGQLELCSALAIELTALGIEPVTARTLRASKEVHNDDGTVTKVAVFNHEGFRSSWTRHQKIYGAHYVLASTALSHLDRLGDLGDLIPEFEAAYDAVAELQLAITELVNGRGKEAMNMRLKDVNANA